jgi:hypothetical protein
MRAVVATRVPARALATTHTCRVARWTTWTGSRRALVHQPFGFF